MSNPAPERIEPERGRRAPDRVAAVTALERPHDVLNRAAAGLCAATIHKLLYSETEAAVILGVSSETLKLWRREGYGPAWVKMGEAKLVRYHIDALSNYADDLPAEPKQDATRDNRIGIGKGRPRKAAEAVSSTRRGTLAIADKSDQKGGMN
jgi:hypothetical protein